VFVQSDGIYVKVFLCAKCDGVIKLVKKGEDFYVGLSKEQVDELRKMYKAGKY
jgi:hypothetical protein